MKYILELNLFYEKEKLPSWPLFLILSVVSNNSYVFYYFLPRPKNHAPRDSQLVSITSLKLLLNSVEKNKFFFLFHRNI